MDSKTRKQIVEVFEIENSVEFKFYKYVSNNLDYVFRYGYAMCYLFFLCYFLSLLYELYWLYVTTIVLFVVSILGWILYHLLRRMRKSDLHMWGALKYYMRCYCILGSKKKRVITFEEEKQLKRLQKQQTMR